MTGIPDGKGGVLLSAPGCVPTKFGLLSVAELVDELTGHWENGVEYDLETCEELFVVTSCPPGDVPAFDKTTDGAGRTDFADAFTMVASYKCSVPGLPVAEAWDHAASRLARGEDRTLERTFWTGLDVQGNDVLQNLGNNADVVDLTPGSGALTIGDGMALLESWAGDAMPCAPIIHAGRGMGVYLAERHIIEADGSVMRSAGTGTRVALGGGYQDTGPAGDIPAAGEVWLFVTGSILVRRGPTFFTPERDNNGAAIDRTINDIVVFAERTYAVEQDCAIAAVRVLAKSAYI